MLKVFMFSDMVKRVLNMMPEKYKIRPAYGSEFSS